MPTAEFKERITADLTSAGVGRAAVNYKLRDWLFSRQHFWGEPFPILHELDAAGNPIRATANRTRRTRCRSICRRCQTSSAHDRPEPPLEQAPESWLYPVIDGVRYKRETNTMPQWAGSCWYYLRFLDPKNEKALVDPAVERAWMPVDLYVGGAEHAVLHLLYARFWHKVLFDRGLVSTAEPFRKLVNQGMILGEMEFTGYQSSDGSWVSASEAEPSDTSIATVKVPAEHAQKQGEGFVLVADPKIRLESRAHKMSKSRGNVVNPDQVVAEYGADALRLYEMFMGPLEATKPWNMSGVNGVRGFLDRVWRMVVNDRAETIELNAAISDAPPTEGQNRVLHRTIKGVTHDLDNMAFNTAIAKMMEFTNYFTKAEVRPKLVIESFLLLLAPFAPHLAEELWQLLGHQKSLAYEPWPEFDEALTKESTVEIPVQIKGKIRGRVVVPADASQSDLEVAARAEPKIAELLAGQTIVKVIVVPGRLVNFVTR